MRYFFSYYKILSTKNGSNLQLCIFSRVYRISLQIHLKAHKLIHLMAKTEKL